MTIDDKVDDTQPICHFTLYATEQGTPAYSVHTLNTPIAIGKTYVQGMFDLTHTEPVFAALQKAIDMGNYTAARYHLSTIPEVTLLRPRPSS